MGSKTDEMPYSSASLPSVILPNHAARHEKRSLIEEACQRADLAALAKLATSTGGLLTDDLRRRAWPILLGYEHEKQGGKAPTASTAWKALPRHSDEDQVRLDVDRAFVYYPRDESEESLERKRTDLYDLIVSTLRQHRILSYFQSYHDVVQVLLLVLGKDSASRAVPRISLLRLRDYMLPTIAPARKHFELVSAVVRTADPELAHHLSEAENSSALSATHSLFAHDVQDYGDIARLYDFLLAHEPIMSIYLFATITISRRSELLELESDQSDMLTYMVAKLPQNLDIDGLSASTIQLFKDHPPEKLPGFFWWRLSSCSVLKTSRDLSRPQTLEEAEALGRKQIQQLRRDESLQKAKKQLQQHRRPLGFAAAILMGALSIYMRKSGYDLPVWSFIMSTIRLVSGRG
ncbi:hypothetical protein PV10_01657 [Exophiala mesophila]|uniref:Rab-GAP TBC domain-containing protein n=1 Tax=Exophiala mesophila TaxID=212818 RepID=A0A0D1ZTU0_EXOME|nr:uncharacterized protein PV10_01657 [Exophiala mesophila]KIV97962.1 hypothetical protein PV10_01657 [Exophiala mesophila]